MSKSLELFKNLRESLAEHFDISEGATKGFDLIEKELKAFEIIVKKANIRLFEMDGRYYFRTTSNSYGISKEKYDLLKEILL